MHLLLIDCNINDSLFISILQSLKSHIELEALIMNNNNIGNIGMSELIINFCYFVNLKKLYIGENKLTYKSLKMFKPNVIHLKNLEEFVIYSIYIAFICFIDNDIGIKGVNEIISGFNFSNLKLLSISGCGIELSKKKMQSKFMKLNYKVIC